jgi:hypothetical protein
MTVEEKLTDLHDTVQRLSEIITRSAQRGNHEFTTIDRRLSTIEKVLPLLGGIVERLQDKPAVQL